MGGETRCFWAQEACALYQEYHDKEWGVPCHDDRHLFEMLVLESFQAGLSWITILKKREAFRQAFDGFDPTKVAGYGEEKIQQLLQDASIVRSRGKIQAAIGNARVFLDIQREFGSFDRYLWGFTEGKTLREPGELRLARTELSDRLAADLKRRGMKYMGTVIAYAYLQAVGVVNGHDSACQVPGAPVSLPRQ